MDSWLGHYLRETLSLDLDDKIIEYYAGFLSDKEISDEEKTEILRAAFRDSDSPALSSEAAIERAVQEILTNYHDPIHGTSMNTVTSTKQEKQERDCSDEDFIPDDQWVEQTIEDEENLLCDDRTPMMLLMQVFSDVEYEELLKTFEQENYNLENTIKAIVFEKTVGIPMISTTVYASFGDSCLFLHTVNTSQLQNVLQNTATAGPVTATPDTSDNELFPSLDQLNLTSTQDTTTSRIPDSPSRAIFVRPPSSTASKANNSSNFAFIAKHGSLVEAFPWIDERTISSYLRFYNNDADAVSAILQKSHPRPPGFVSQDTGNSKSSTTGKNRKERKKFVVKPLDNIPWLVAGNALSKEYKKYREQAIQAGKQRNILYEAATKAYKANRGDLAKKYSLEAQKYNELMRELHREASRKIFEARNSSYYGKEPFIDLHGQHVDEAISYLKESIDTLKKENYNGSIIYIVTGTGHHSQDRPKIGPAVKSWLDEHEYEYCECSIDKRYGGMIAVNFR
ncbi:10075_t:CDS:2 [Paraglomus brasilianum]|uniref:10075_t:CDS:1 n=1 Tax=Paraglomus brasilianum TaxID=144538 RepID=A0A9N9FK55_9GLOM|nr:10075_t:CDS:2 [Paraglomus brasilianum]